MVDNWRTRPWLNQGPYPVYPDDTVRTALTQPTPADQIAAGVKAQDPLQAWAANLGITVPTYQGGGDNPITVETFTDPKTNFASQDWVLNSVDRGPNRTGQASTQMAPASASVAASGGGNTNSKGYNLGGWDLSKNKYTYTLPAEFVANQNMYQLGYNPAEDRQILNVAGGDHKQDNFGRVYGWMNELARQNGYADIANAPKEMQADFAAYAIGRLRTDYANTGQDWRNSGFAGYDRYLTTNQAAQPGGTPAPTGTAPPTATPQTAPTAAPQTAPQTTAATPTTNSGGTPVSAAIDPQGTTARSTPAAGSTRYGPASAAAIAQDPDLAYRALLQSQGKTYAPRGMFTSFRQNLFGNALSAYINLLTSGGGQTLDNIGDMLGGFGQAMGGGNFYGQMADTARGALGGIDLGSLDASKVDQLVKQVMGLQTMGLSPFAQNSAQNQYKDQVRLYEDNALANDMNEDQNYGDFMKNSPFFNSLRALGGK